MRVEQRDAERVGLDRRRRSRTAARGRGRPRSRPAESSRNVLRTSTIAVWQPPLAASSSARPVWKTTVLPDSAVSCATACSWSRGLPTSAALAVGDLVRADDERVRELRGDAAGLGFGEPQRRCRGRFARQRRFVGCRRRHRERQPELGQQRAPVARRRRQHQRPRSRRRAGRGARRVGCCFCGHFLTSARSRGIIQRF